jgi:DNA-binding IclR family transcriptional regulator
MVVYLVLDALQHQRHQGLELDPSSILVDIAAVGVAVVDIRNKVDKLIIIKINEIY